jgi:HD-like signal output (HDOD) protein
MPQALSRKPESGTHPWPLPGPACLPIEDGEIVAAARSMNLAANGAGGSARLMAALIDASADLPSLAQRINAQPAIAVRVMRVANSAYYGHSGTVSTLDRAARLLGLTALRGIAAAACFDRLTASSARGAALDLPAFQRHSLATACAAQALARHAAPQWAEEAFMAGLLHDLGVAVQWRLRPQWMARLQAGALLAAGQHPGPSAGPPGHPGLGATHGHCAGVLLASWQLPASLVAAVAEHDAAHDAPETAPPLSALVRLADALAHGAGLGFMPEHPAVPADAQALERLGLRADQWAEAGAALPGDVQRLLAVFGD